MDPSEYEDTLIKNNEIIDAGNLELLLPPSMSTIFNNKC